jgi:hypothetical protein
VDVHSKVRDEPMGTERTRELTKAGPAGDRSPAVALEESAQGGAVLDWEGGFEPEVIAFADLPAQLAADLVPDDDRIWPSPFWLSVNDDTITAIEEQYIP